ncbi:MAG: type I restriction enzyme S subunit [Anaerolineaceae bacterium]|nr:MAG: type I restriction enzyme S subunit [Anaerolineaceae bacterium]
MGPFGSSIKVETFVPTGIPVVSGQHLHGFRLNENAGFNFVTEEHADKLKNANVFRGDIIFTHAGNIENVAYIPENSKYERYVASQRQFYMRCDLSKILPSFVVYYFNSHEGKYKLTANSSSVGVPSIAQPVSYLRKLEIPVPPLPEQHAIVGILDALDTKIEINRRMNVTLESITRAVFRQWFVENEEVKSWEIQTLQQHIEAEKGLSYKGEGLSKDGGTPMHNLNSVYEGGGYKYSGIKYYTGEYRERHIINAGDIIVTNTEQGFQYLLIGFPAIVPKHFGGKGIFTHHIFRVRPLSTSPVKTHYLYFLLMNPYVRDQIIGCTNGTTVNMLSADGLRTPKFHLPPKQLIDEFEKFATPIFEKMELIHEESRMLGSLRDSLLPKLMRGEVRVGA